MENLFWLCLLLVSGVFGSFDCLQFDPGVMIPCGRGCVTTDLRDSSEPVHHHCGGMSLHLDGERKGADKKPHSDESRGDAHPGPFLQLPGDLGVLLVLVFLTSL